MYQKSGALVTFYDDIKFLTSNGLKSCLLEHIIPMLMQRHFHEICHHSINILVVKAKANGALGMGIRIMQPMVFLFFGVLLCIMCRCSAFVCCLLCFCYFLIFHSSNKKQTYGKSFAILIINWLLTHLQSRKINSKSGLRGPSG